MPAPTEHRQMIEGSQGSGTPAPPGVTVDVGAVTHAGLVRSTNEDAYAIFRLGRFVERVSSNLSEEELPTNGGNAGVLMMIADGLGGHEAGEVASRSALANVIRLVTRSPHWALKLDDPATREAEIRSLMERTRAYLTQVHAAIRDQASGDARLAGMGTTLTSVYAVGADLFVLHVGDSKACLLRRGRLERITHDHTVAQDYADRGFIPQDEVAGHRMHHVLTRAVGGPDERLEGDIHHLGLEHGDRILICSDGLTDMVAEGEIEALLAATPRSQEACDALVQLALARGGHDNVTVIVAGFTFPS